MEVHGPDYSFDESEKAFNEIYSYLRDYYKVHNSEVDDELGEVRKTDKINLKNVINSLFIHKSWENW
jgi:hypothetical protein